MSFPGKDPRFNSTILTDIGVGVPANPAAGSHKIVDRSGILYLRDSAGAETQVGGSFKYTANMRAVEGGGTVTLTNSDQQFQVFDLSAAETVVLPTTSVLKGDLWVMENKPTGFQLDIQASDASAIESVEAGFVAMRALINTPVTNTDWEVINYYSYGSSSINFVFNGTAGGGTGGITVSYVRINQNIITTIPSATATTGSSGTTALVSQTAIPVIYRPTSSFSTAAGIVQNAVNYTAPGMLTVDNSGLLILYADYGGSSAWSASITAGFSGNAGSYSISYSK